MSNPTFTTINLDNAVSRAISADVKVTADHMAASKTLQQAAVEGIWKIYRDFDFHNTFITSIVDQYLSTDRITHKQAACILNHIIDLAKANHAASAPVENHDDDTVVTMAELPNGIFTVVFEGEHITIKIEDSWLDRHPTGQRAASYLHSGNEWQGFAFISPVSKVYMWKKFQNNYKLLHALETITSSTKNEVIEYGKAYALMSGNCWKCGRMLTTPESINAGIGPICANKL